MKKTKIKDTTTTKSEISNGIVSNIKEKAVLYLRVSSKGQEDNFSLDAQERLAIEYAEKNNLEIVKKWDGFESGWGKFERKNFLQLLDYVKGNYEIKHIIFDILDRMTRNDKDKIKIQELIDNYDKVVHFTRTNKRYDKNASPEDKFMLDIDVAVAKKMSNDISRKTKMGLDESVKQGIYPHTPPVGYVKIDKKIVKDDFKANLIVQLYDMVISGHYSVNYLSNFIYEKGLCNSHNGKYKGHKLTETSIRRLISSPFYYGVFKWNNKYYNGNYEPIVTKETWDKANKILDDNLRRYNKDSTYHFSRLLTCFECNNYITGANTIKHRDNPLKANKYRYYRCEDQKNHKEKGYVSESDLANKLFLSVIQKVSMPENITEVLKENVELMANNQTNIKKTKKEITEKDLNNLTKQLSRLYDLQIQGKISNVDMFSRKEKELTDLIEKKKNTLKMYSTDEQETIEKAEETFFLVNNLEQIYKESDYEDKASIIKELCGISILKGKTIIPNYNEPFRALATIKEEIEDIKPKDIELDKMTKKNTPSFKSWSENIKGRVLDEMGNQYVYEPVKLNLVGINNVRFNKNNIKIF